MRRLGRPARLAIVLVSVVAGALVIELRGREAGEEAPVLGIAAESITGLRVETGNRRLAAVRAGSTWRVLDPTPAAPRAVEAVGALADALARVVAIDTFTRAEVDRGELGLEPPRMRVTVELDGGRAPVVLRLGDFVPTGGSVYASIDGDPRVLQIGALLATEVERTLHIATPGR